jgi:glycerol-3-phosphate acyltransferase PlsY
MIMNEILIFLQDKPWLLIILCGLSGYLAGSISSARIVYFFVKGTTKVEPFAESVPHSDETFESDLVSATLITKKLGARYGCITSIMDMLKVVIPVLIIKIVFKSDPYFLIVAIFGVCGHNFPVYHKFAGGRGESPILGILLVVNWFGIIIANAAAILLGFITGSVLVVRWGGYVLLIFWFLIYFNDYRYVVFMILLNFFFWFSMRKDLARFIGLKKKGLKFTEEEVSEFILMGRRLGRALDKYSLYSLYRKIKAGKTKE